MANNDRALHLVLDVRKRDEDKALESLSDIRQKIVLFEQQIVQMNEFRQSYMQDVIAKGQQGFKANVYMSYQGFLDKLEDLIAKQQSDLELLKLEEKNRLMIYLDKQKQRKIIESLLEKHRLERIKLENKKEQKMLDDFVVSSYSRRNHS